MCLTNGKLRDGNQTPVNTGLASSGFVVPLRRITAVTRSGLYPVMGCLAEQVVEFRAFSTLPVRGCGSLLRSCQGNNKTGQNRSEEHTSELQSLRHLVCRLLLEK